jgi:hypothetical protein
MNVLDSHREVLRVIFSLLAVSSLSAAEPVVKHYLYMSTPDAAQQEGSSGDGVLIFNIDDGHRFVRRIDIPSFKEGLRGFTPSAKNHCAYFSTTNRRLGCIDLETDKVLWERTYSAGCDRSCKSGKVLHRVLAGETPIKHRTHGAGLTPDETELWISDQQGQKLFIFDATQMPPKPKGNVGLIREGHGWVCFSLDGQYAWCHTPDVYNARTKQRVALLKDQNDRLFASSKFFEVHFRDGKVIRTGHEFGLGRAHTR